MPPGAAWGQGFRPFVRYLIRAVGRLPWSVRRLNLLLTPSNYSLWRSESISESRRSSAGLARALRKFTTVRSQQVRRDTKEQVRQKAQPGFPACMHRDLAGAARARNPQSKRNRIQPPWANAVGLRPNGHTMRHGQQQPATAPCGPTTWSHLWDIQRNDAGSVSYKSWLFNESYSYHGRPGGRPQAGLLCAELYGDPAHEPGRGCNGSPGPSPGLGGQIRPECARLWSQATYGLPPVAR